MTGSLCCARLSQPWGFKVFWAAVFANCPDAEQLSPAPFPAPSATLNPAKCARLSLEMTKYPLVNCTTDCLELKVLIYMTIALTAQ